MTDSGEDEEDDFWFRPVWETEEEIEPPGKPRPRPERKEPDYTHPLLGPLACAQDTVAKLEARIEAASAGIGEGLRARLSYREASGWLAYSHVWIYPRDLALRDAGFMIYGPAAAAGRLTAELPATTSHGSEFEVVPSDLAIDQALRFADIMAATGGSFAAGSRSKIPPRYRKRCNFSVVPPLWRKFRTGWLSPTSCKAQP